jgi:cell division protein FtsZ
MYPNTRAQDAEELSAKIVVIGVGGAGGNAVGNMIAAELEGVDFIVANTDAQALNHSTAKQRLQLGAKLTQGLGAGARPEVGKAAAEEALLDIEQALGGAHMCFIAAGMGGGTGTGAAPIIAKAARDRGILTVGVVTKPFSFEGARRMRAAEAGIEELQKNVDTLIVIPNQNLFLIASPKTGLKEAFLMADDVLHQGVRGITDLMVKPGLINLDFADIRSVMSEMGKAMMGTGEASGESRALEATKKAIANPLLDGVSLQGARAVIISISGGDDLGLMELEEAAGHVKTLVDDDANIIFGTSINPELDGKIRVSVVATGIEANAAMVTQSEPVRIFNFPVRKEEKQESAHKPEPIVLQPETAHAKPVTVTLERSPERAPEPAEAAKQEDKVAPIRPIYKPDYLANMIPTMQRKDQESEPHPASAPLQNAQEAFKAAMQNGARPLAEPAPPQHAAQEEELVLRVPIAPEPQNDASQEQNIVNALHQGMAAPPAPRTPAAGGGTLFERMAKNARNTAKPDAAASEGGAPEIPAFLKRQANS